MDQVLKEDLVSEKKTTNETSLAEELEETPDDQKTEQASGADSDDLAAQLEECQKKSEDMQNKLLRLGAEFENYKKRIEREKATILEYAEEHIVRELLAVLDNLERALDQGKENQNYAALLEGVELTYKGMKATLEKFGLKALDSKGQPFDPNFHEALAMEASTDVAENHVLNEFQKGYQYKARLVRPAKVIVSKGKV